MLMLLLSSLLLLLVGWCSLRPFIVIAACRLSLCQTDTLRHDRCVQCPVPCASCITIKYHLHSLRDYVHPPLSIPPLYSTQTLAQWTLLYTVGLKSDTLLVFELLLMLDELILQLLFNLLAYHFY